MKNCAEEGKMFIKTLLLAVCTVALCIDCNTDVVVHGKAPTYQHQDPVTGKMLSCDHCPPGTHLHSHCTATRQTVCAPCPASHYTQYWNYLYSCQYCNNFCNENQFVKKECSALHNRICECREGYFWDSEFCLKHTECPSGYGIKVKGTAYRDTLCEKCPSGYFSSKTLGHLSCVKHTNCTTLGLKQVLQGTAWHNSLCVPCNDLEAQGNLPLYREFLPDFFARQKMKRKKVIRFGISLFREEGMKLLEDHTHLSAQKLIQVYVIEWMSLRKTGTDPVKTIMDLLKKSSLHKVARKLGRKLKPIFESNPCHVEKNSKHKTH